MFDIQHSEQQNVSSYKNYPADKPFINSDWVRPSRTLSKAYPESNRDLIMSSLKKLQEKINRLELKSDAPSPVKQINDIEDQSSLTENRIVQLEKQLEKMRNMVNSEQQPSKTNDDWLSSNKRLKNLEKETLLLDAEQQFTDTHMKHLEDKLKLNEPKQRSKSHRKHKNRKNKQSAKDKTKYVPDTNNNNEKFIKEYRKIKRSHSVDNACCTRTFTHYRLNIADIPFVVGKSITPSHHLGSNIQNVISLLKLHHPKLCNSVAHGKGNYQAALPSTLVKHNSRNKKKKRQPNLLRSISVPPSNNHHNDDNNYEISNGRIVTTRSPKDDTVANTNRNGNFYYEYLNENELRELLRQMQEEYTKLVLEHYEITKRIMNCLDEKVRDDYELKAAELDHRMRKKASQIAKIKQFQNRNFTNKNPKYSKLSIDPVKRSNSIRKLLRNLSSTSATTPTTSTSSSANIINSTNDINTSNNNNNNNNNTNYTSTINSDYPHFMSPYSFAFFNSNISNEHKNHNKSLKFFKDIKSLQNRIQNDQVIF